MIPVLFVADNSLYLNDRRFDCYTQDRDAMTCFINRPAIYHPPCRLFSKMKGFSSAGMCEKFYGYYSVMSARRFGGIVEHPSGTTLFNEMDCNLDGSIDRYGGFLRSVNLSWFGFPAEKKTLLYFCGIKEENIPPFPISFDAVTHCIGHARSKDKRLKLVARKDRSTTPLLMIDFFARTLIN